MTTPRETNLSAKTIRDSTYEQKPSTKRQIVAFCPFHMGISVDKEIIGPIKIFCYWILKSGRTARKNRPYHGFDRLFDGWAKRKEFVVFIWGSDVK